MTRHYAIVAAIAATAWALGAAAPVSAQKMYKWTDKDGKIHFSNLSPEGDATAVGDDSSVSGVEAKSPEAAASSEAGSAAPDGAAPRADTATVSAASGDAVTDEMFSNKASAMRLRLKRELATAKDQAKEATDKLAALRQERDKPPQMGIETLVSAYGKEHHGEGEEDGLAKEKEKADKHVQSIRQEYADLHSEAVKRLGHEPSWWLPLD